MKYFKNLSFAACLTLLLSITYNPIAAQTYTALNQELITNLTIQSPKTIKVNLANLMKASTIFSVKGLDGKLWYEEYIKDQMGYGKKLNFKKLPIGFYYLLVEHKGQEMKYYFTIDKRKIEFFPPESPQKEPLTYQNL